MGRPHLFTSAAVAATAVLGGAGTAVRSRWYRRLDEPGWDPPGPVHGRVSTVVHALTAVGTGLALTRVPDRAARRGYLAALGLDLALDAGWSWVFSRGRRPRVDHHRGGSAGGVRAGPRPPHLAVGRVGGARPAPCAGRVVLATALSAALARRNDAG